MDSVTSLSYAMKAQKLLNKTLTTCMRAVSTPMSLELEEYKFEVILFYTETLGREGEGKGRERRECIHLEGMRAMAQW